MVQLDFDISGPFFLGKSVSATVSPCDGENQSPHGKSVLFQRSISEIASSTSNDTPVDANIDPKNRTPVVRRRNNSGGLAGG